MDVVEVGLLHGPQTQTCGSRKHEPLDSIAYFWLIVDPWIHGMSIPIFSYVGDYICPISAVFTGGECGAAESVVSVSKIRTKAKNQAC